MDKKLEVLLVEDHALTRFGLKTTLEQVDFIGKVVESEDGESAVELVKQKNHFDVILMDLGLSGISGVEATQQIKEFNNNQKVIILTSHNEEEEIMATLKAGANAYCLKDIAPPRLIQVIESVSEGATWLDPAIASLVMNKISSHEVESQSATSKSASKINLTDREAQVLKLIVDGLSNAEISEKLCVSIHTAKAHVCNILQKLSVDDRTQAAIKALKDNIV